MVHYVAFALAALLHQSAAFAFSSGFLPRNIRTSSILRSSNDYMSFLSNPQASNGSVDKQSSSTSYSPQSPPQPPISPPPISEDQSSNSAPPPNFAQSSASPLLSFYHAPLSFFYLDLLTPKGPRKGADIGAPHDATRRMDMDTRLAAGSWWCAAGGWPSSTPRETTEVFWVMEGHGCVTDQDGTRHYFGPGDTVILPMLWTGRWDVLEPIHKVWCVHDHVPLPEVAHRAIVAPYHKLVDTGVAGLPSGGEAYSTLFETRFTRVGCTTYPAGSAYNQNNAGATEWWHILEGVLYLTDGVDGSAQRCVPGDTVVVPAGWNGHADIMEPVKKLWVQVAD